MMGHILLEKKYKEVDGSACFESLDGSSHILFSHPLSFLRLDYGSEINKMITRSTINKHTATIEAHQQQRINITSIIERYDGKYK